MSRIKVFISILMVLILIALSVASVWAAPGAQDETISGEVQEIVIEDGVVLVTLLVDENTTQTVRMSLETAQSLGLVDENGDPLVNIGDDVEIPLSDDIEVIDDGEEGAHPVASALADFFAETLGLDYDMVMGYHEDGMGFGVIAQACWMSFALEGDATLLGDILAAKKSHDFSSIELPDGSTASNWGQFKKAVMGSDKAKKNLGAIMSGRADDGTNGDLGASSNLGQGKDKKGKGPGEDGPPGKSKDGGPPAVPPGQAKDKDKGGGKGKDK